MKIRFLSTLVIFLSLVACTKKEKQQEIEKTTQAVKTIVAEERKFTQEIEYTGTFFANREANLGSSMPGKIEKFYYPEGTFVTKGTLLVELSAEILTQALIEYDAIKKDYDRVSRLREKGSISEIEYDHLKAKLDASEVKTQMLRNNTSVYAPFDGIVVEYLVEEGENFFFNLNLDPGYSNTSGILRLMQINPLIVKIQVNEKDLPNINKGQKVRVICDAMPGKELTGTVHYVKPILSTITRSAEVEIEVPNQGNTIKPGMFSRVFVHSNDCTGVFIPVDAIYRQPGTPDDFVFVVRTDTANRVKIKRLASIDQWVAVEGINAGDVVVTQGKNKINDKQLVRIKND